MAKAAKASAKGKPAQKTNKKPAKAAAKATTAKAAAPKAKPAAKPSKAPVAKAKAEPKAVKAKPAAAAPVVKAEKAAKVPKEKKAASPSPTIMSGAPVDPDAPPVVKPKKEPKPKVDKVEARKARRAAKDLLAGLEKLADARAKWEALYAKATDLVAEPYKMSGVYEPRTAVMHKVLGWGYILNAQNDRLEVLFKDGVKMLISNYKPS